VYYETKYFFNDHPIIEFETLNFQGKWQVFSAYYTDPNTDYIRTTFRDDADFISFLDTIKQDSMYDTGVTVDETDTILTLSTCSVSDEEGRFTVHAKWIKPKK
jgi:sortase B